MPSPENPDGHPDSRFGRVSMTLETLGHLKANILKLCQVSKRCTTSDFATIDMLENAMVQAKRLMFNARKLMTK